MFYTANKRDNQTSSLRKRYFLIVLKHENNSSIKYAGFIKMFMYRKNKVLKILIIGLKWEAPARRALSYKLS